MPRGLAGLESRRPIASRPGQKRWASRSSTMTTGGAVGGIAAVEVSPAHERNAHRLEVAVARRDLMRRHERFPRSGLALLGEDDAAAVDPAERDRRRQSGGADARQRARALEQTAGDLCERRVIAVCGRRQIDRCGQHPGRLESGIDREHGAEAREQQSGADEQHEGERDLRGSEQAAQSAGRDPCRAAAARVAHTSLRLARDSRTSGIRPVTTPTAAASAIMAPAACQSSPISWRRGRTSRSSAGQQRSSHQPAATPITPPHTASSVVSVSTWRPTRASSRRSHDGSPARASGRPIA